MRKAKVFVKGVDAGVLEESDEAYYKFSYHEQYNNAPVSLTMPLSKRHYEFKHFPLFFEGLLPEGVMLDGLLRKHKLDRNDLFGQLTQVGQDLVGAVTIESIE